MIGIYKIENLVNGKNYIGQSVDIKDRWKEHKQIAFRQTEAAKICENYPLYRAFRKYGLENFDFSIVEECDEKELNSREIYWVDYYKTFTGRPDNWGYNLTRGGDGNKRLPQEYVDWFIELWNQGKPTGEIERITGKNKHTIIQYLKWYEPSYSVEEAQRRGNISSGINHRKQVIQYDFLGREIQKFCSVKEAVQKTGFDKGMISKSLACQTKGTNSYYFVYDDEDKIKNLKILMSIPSNKRGFFPIIQTDLNGNYINYFLTLKDAANSVNGTSSLISSCARGIYQTAYKYKWHIITFDLVEKYNLKEVIPKFEQ